MLLPIFIPEGGGANNGRSRSTLFMTLFFFFFFVLPMFRNDNAETASRDRLADPEVILLDSGAPASSNKKIVIQLFPVIDGKQTSRSSMSVFLMKGKTRSYEIVPGQAEVADASVLRVVHSASKQNEMSFHCRNMHACGFLEGKLLSKDISKLLTSIKAFVRRIYGQDSLDKAREFFQAHESHLSSLIHSFRQKQDQPRAFPTSMDYLDLLYEYYEGIIQGSTTSALSGEEQSQTESLTLNDLFILNAFASGELLSVAAKYSSRERRSAEFSKLKVDSEKRDARLQLILSALFQHGSLSETVQVVTSTEVEPDLRSTWLQARWVPADVHDLRIIRTTTLELDSFADRTGDSRLRRVVMNSIGLPGCLSAPYSLTSIRSEAIRGSTDFAIVFQNLGVIDGLLFDSIPAPPDQGGSLTAPLLFIKVAIANLAAQTPSQWAHIISSMSSPSLSEVIPIPTPGEGDVSAWSPVAVPTTAPARIVIASARSSSRNDWIAMEILPNGHKVENITARMNADRLIIWPDSFSDVTFQEKSGIARLERIQPQDIALHDQEFIKRIYGNNVGRSTSDASLVVRRAYKDGVIEAALAYLREEGISLSRVEDRVDIKS